MPNFIKRLKVMEVAIVDKPAVPGAKFLLFKRARAAGGVVPFEPSLTAPEEAPWELANEERAALPDSAFLWIEPSYASGESSDESLRKGPHHDARGRVVWRAVAVLAALLDGARRGIDVPEEDLPDARDHVAKHYHQFAKLAPWEREAPATEPRDEARPGVLQVAKLLAEAFIDVARNSSPAAAMEPVGKGAAVPILKQLDDLTERVGRLEAALTRASLPGQDAGRGAGKESIWKGMF